MEGDIQTGTHTRIWLETWNILKGLYTILSQVSDIILFQSRILAVYIRVGRSNQIELLLYSQSAVIQRERLLGGDKKGEKQKPEKRKMGSIWKRDNQSWGPRSQKSSRYTITPSLSLYLSIFTFVFANGMENVVKKSKDIYSYKTRPQVAKLLCL